MNWSRADLNAIYDEIRHRNRRKRDIIAEKLSNHLGIDVESIKTKMHELETLHRLKKLAKGVRS